jgi:hypothetical protein
MPISIFGRVVITTSVLKRQIDLIIRVGSSPASYNLLTKNLSRLSYLIRTGFMHTLSSSSVSTPKRQSCDRCHKQKLRCLRPTDGDGGACERCIRSKAQCVYSSSLPKGRPSSHRQNRRIANAENVKSSSGNIEATSEGAYLGLDNNDHPATVTDEIIIAEQHLDQTTTATWDNPMDWIEYIDDTIPDQWYSESQNVCSSSQNRTLDIVLLTRPRIHSDGLTPHTPILSEIQCFHPPHQKPAKIDPVIRQRSLVCPA